MDGSATLEQFATLLIFLCLVACMVVLAISQAKWEAFKRMIMAVASFAAGVLLIGLLGANLAPSPLLAEVTAVLLVLGSVLAGTIEGCFHVRAEKRKIAESSRSQVIGIY